MKPKPAPDRSTDDLFRNRLDNLIDRRHELVKRAAVIHWQRFDDEWGEAFCAHGRPAIATRLIAGLHYLKHTYGLSDEQAVPRWAENPYWQYFCGGPAAAVYEQPFRLRATPCSKRDKNAV